MPRLTDPAHGPLHRARATFALMLIAAMAWLVMVAGDVARGEIPASIRHARLVHQFDFEEVDDGNYESMPMNWHAIGRAPDHDDPNFLRIPLHVGLTRLKGYPRHGQIGFNKPTHEPGEHFLQLHVVNGQAGAFVEVGTLPADPGSDYLIAGRVKTSRLRHAAARVVAYFLDSRGEPIPDSAVTTGPIRSHERWRVVSLRLRGKHPDAAWLGLQAEVRQPDRPRDTPLGEAAVVLDDARATAMFDDLTLWQLPHASIAPEGGVGVFTGVTPPSFRIDVRDFVNQRLLAIVELRDEHGEIVAHAARRAGAGQPMHWTWSPRLQRFGWYDVQLSVRDAERGGAALASARTSLLWLDRSKSPADAAAPTSSRDADRFGLDATGVDRRWLDLVTTAATRLGIGGLTVDAWASGDRAEAVAASQAELGGLLDRLPHTARGPTMVLRPLPIELRRRLQLDPDEPAVLFDRPLDQWLDYLAPTAMRHGHRSRQWQIGATPRGPVGPEAPPRDWGAVRSVLDAAAPNPTLVVPGSVYRSPPAGLTREDRMALHVPRGVRPEELAAQLDAFAPTGNGPGIELHLDTAGARELGHPARIRDLVLRLLHGSRTSASRMVIRTPWALVDEPRMLAPDPLLGVLATTSQRLAGRRVVGELPLGEAIRAWVLDGPGGAMLVAWNVAGAEPEASLRMWLGERPEMIDVWGNTSPPKVDGRGRHVIPLGRTPVFVEGIDGLLARFRASARLSPAFLESSARPQEVRLSLGNPWPRQISGQVTLQTPETWDVRPRRVQLAIPPGGAQELVFRVLLPQWELTGEKRLPVEVRLSADRAYDIVIELPLEVGLRDLRQQADLLLERDPATGRIDAIVTQLVTNLGERDKALYGFAQLPGHARQERIIARLAPGQTELRQYRFRDALATLRDQGVRVGVRTTAGPASLNDLLRLSEADLRVAEQAAAASAAGDDAERGG